jgi:hypothetical protein
LHKNLFKNIICLENLFDSWREFRRGKKTKPDVQLLERQLETNIFLLNRERERERELALRASKR